MQTYTTIIGNETTITQTTGYSGVKSSSSGYTETTGYSGRTSSYRTTATGYRSTSSRRTSSWSAGGSTVTAYYSGYRSDYIDLYSSYTDDYYGTSSSTHNPNAQARSWTVTSYTSWVVRQSVAAAGSNTYGGTNSYRRTDWVIYSIVHPVTSKSGGYTSSSSSSYSTRYSTTDYSQWYGDFTPGATGRQLVSGYDSGTSPSGMYNTTALTRIASRSSTYYTTSSDSNLSSVTELTRTSKSGSTVESTTKL